MTPARLRFLHWWVFVRMYRGSRLVHQSTGPDPFYVAACRCEIARTMAAATARQPGHFLVHRERRELTPIPPERS